MVPSLSQHIVRIGILLYIGQIRLIAGHRNQLVGIAEDTTKQTYLGFCGQWRHALLWWTDYNELLPIWDFMATQKLLGLVCELQ